MTFIRPILGVARSIGVENFAQVKNFVRTVKGMKGAEKGVASLHLEYPHAQYEKALIKMAKENPLIDPQTILQIRMLFPQLQRPGVKNFIDIIAKKYGAKSGKITLNSVTKAANGENLAQGTAKILVNESGGRVVAKANAEVSNLAADYDVAMTRGLFTGLTKPPEIKNLAKAYQYSVNDGVAELGVSPIVSKGLKAKVKVKADEFIFDSLTGIITKGKWTSFEEAFKQAQKAIG